MHMANNKIYTTNNTLMRSIAILRRLFLGGVLALIVCLLLIGFDINRLKETAIGHDFVQMIFAWFFLLAPVFYIFSVLFSTFLIRTKGQFAVLHKQSAFFVTFFKCVKSDLISPIKNVKLFFGQFSGDFVIGRSTIIIRFVELLFLVALCTLGICLLVL